MLREICEALEALTADTPLVLVLEDLHWADLSTVDLLSAMSRRQQPARLLLVATYRPVDVILSDHPVKSVKQELSARRLCHELPLGPLTEEAVAEYLAIRFPDGPLEESLTPQLFQRSQGNPLFLANLIDDGLAQGFLDRRSGRWEWHDESRGATVPESIRVVIERRIGRLTEDERLTLEAASVAGSEFSAAVVAAAMQASELSVEADCDGFARRHLILERRGAIEWPDGTATGRYRFRHELYRQALYEGLPVARRAQLHQQIGNRLEAAHGSAATEVAAELAGHFEQGRDFARAMQYLRKAAKNASRHGATREARDYLGRALHLAGFLPESDRPVSRLALLEQRGLVCRGGGDMIGAVSDFTTAAAEARNLGLAEQEATAQLYLASVLSWSDRKGCLSAVDEAVALIPKLTGPYQSAHVRGWAAYWNMLWRGWSDEDARHNALAVEAARRAGDPALLGQLVGRHAYFLALSSQYEQASRAAEEGAQLALLAGDVSEYLLCQYFLGWAYLHSGRWGDLQTTLHTGIDTAEKNGHRPWALFLRLVLAWLHEQARDYEGARILGEATLSEAIELRVRYGEIVSLILLGYTHLGLQDLERSLGYFEQAGHQLDQGLSVLGTVWRMPLHLGLGECRLKQGDFAATWKEAARLAELAAQSRERTYLVHAGRLLAEVALAEGDLSRAEEALERALAIADTGEVPLAAGKLYATAGRVYEMSRPSSVGEYRARSRAEQNALAQSLGKEHPLARHLLNPTVVSQ